MIEELTYPFEGDYILRKKRSLLRKLKEDDIKRIEKRIAILGGSTTHEIKETLELFLLNAGIAPYFYESEYNKYWEDIVFENDDLDRFAPDIIFIHTTNRNITCFPEVNMDRAQTDELLENEYKRYLKLWEMAKQKYGCVIIQNNFELPFYRLLGNKDSVDFRGRTNYIQKLNSLFAEYASDKDDFYINDICWLSAEFGLSKWQDSFSWHMYKYAPGVSAIPALSHNVSNIIKSIYGKNKKAIVSDLDNTIWGGVIAEDGVENIEIGQETPTGQVYAEFQQYLKDLTGLGVMLCVASKNDEENALKGISRKDNVLSQSDFISFKANWENKDKNIIDIANELNISTESLVFIDDNPAERYIVKGNVQDVSVPEITSPEDYIKIIDRSGFFEVTNFSDDDLKRNSMYKANIQRNKQKENFSNYAEYLKSLNMHAHISDFKDIYISRVAQLTNKSNQFNLTTKRSSQAEIQQIAKNPSYITLCGRLEDKFGDNGIVSVVYGHIENFSLHIDLWLMSCRVLKRNMEETMLDALVDQCRKKGIQTIIGYYYPTAKNKMVKDFFKIQGFDKVSEDEKGNTIWKLDNINQYKNKNNIIEVHYE